MWIFVFFDLPTETAALRKEYAQFRKKLLKDGFQMQQFSCIVASVEVARVQKYISSV
jgi:CRISPR-associated protein Cas2